MSQPDELIDFHHLKMRKGLSKVEIEDSVASDLARATGLADAAAAASNRLNKIVQLTGFSDPIYAEAYVTGAWGGGRGSGVAVGEGVGTRWAECCAAGAGPRLHGSGVVLSPAPGTGTLRRCLTPPQHTHAHCPAPHLPRPPAPCCPPAIPPPLVLLLLQCTSTTSCSMCRSSTAPPTRCKASPWSWPPWAT